ncbi:DUF4234 domain-containing protein [Vibrio caribbeanicus]|uniref:DUF4234 domain-containing protein n=1 Tax=Vibrio caribbeanicus ATCC BAA-2122 TaxID=796620 RepID=E3BQA9_9VIBR|nr:DUF4234 domain-containing protein [Vibrio caribbeanicus]EFP94733.1 hypothetical protein VIBC2010_13451 [Vibrio caribbeanicus ATCC BAA-2122]
MSDTSDIPFDESENISPLDEKQTKKVKMSYPKKPIFDWFLMFSTLGLYAIFWLYRCIKELNQISQCNFKPWLWIFVPPFALVQYHAFRRLDKALVDLESDDSNPRVGKMFYSGVLGFMLATVYFTATSKWATPMWLEFIIILISTSSFCAISYRVNSLKRQLTGVEFTGKENGYNKLEWATVLIMTPIIVATFAFTIITPLMAQKIDVHHDKSIFVQEKHNYKITFHGDDWQQMGLGTYSDGTALAEFKSADFESYFLVFDYDGFNADELNDHIRWRREWIEEQIGQSNCIEKRHLVGEEFAVKAEMICNELSAIPEAAGFVAFIATQNKTYELLGILSQPRSTFKSKKVHFETMLKEFTLQ